MKKPGLASLPLLLFLCTTAAHAQDLDPQLAGVRLKEMTIYLSIPYYGSYSYTHRYGPNQETTHEEGTGTILHRSEIHGDEATWLRSGDLFTVRYYSDSMALLYDSAGNSFSKLDYIDRNYGNFGCYGGTTALISMTQVPIAIEQGLGVRVDWSSVQDWRQRVTSWAYNHDEDCPVPYHNSYTGHAYGDSLLGPIQFVIASGSMSVPARPTLTSLHYQVHDGALTLTFDAADKRRELTISDILGREVLRAVIPASMSSIDIPLHHIPKGAVLMNLEGSTLKLVL